MTPPTSLVLFHCRFRDDGPFDVRAHWGDESGFETLPHLYVVCAVDDSSHSERMIAGLLVKTSISHEASSFLYAMAAAFEAVPRLGDSMRECTSMLSMPVHAVTRPPTAKTAASLFRELWSSHMASQAMTQ